MTLDHIPTNAELGIPPSPYTWGDYESCPDHIDNVVIWGYPTLLHALFGKKWPIKEYQVPGVRQRRYEVWRTPDGQKMGRWVWVHHCQARKGGTAND